MGEKGVAIAGLVSWPPVGRNRWPVTVQGRLTPGVVALAGTQVGTIRAMAQKVVGFRVSHVVGASNDRVWGVLGDFGNEHRWTKSLTHCERDTATVQVGTWRTCVLPRPLMGRTRVP